MEFKGTKGKWFVKSSSDYTGEYSLRADLYAPTFEEDEANVLLISKAPEMLETLIKVNESLLNDSSTIEQIELRKEVEELIKKATTI